MTAPIASIAFSPDGQRLATANKDFKVRFWDAKSGKPIGNALDQGSSIFAMRFFPDGKTIAVAALDQFGSGRWSPASPPVR